MTLGEFKAWLEGYESSFGVDQDPSAPFYPTALQWNKIKEKIETIQIVSSSPAKGLGGYTPPPNSMFLGGNQLQKKLDKPFVGAGDSDDTVVGAR